MHIFTIFNESLTITYLMVLNNTKGPGEIGIYRNYGISMIWYLWDCNFLENFAKISKISKKFIIFEIFCILSGIQDKMEHKKAAGVKNQKKT